MQYKRRDMQADRMHPECAKNEQTLEGKGTSCITRPGFQNEPCIFTEIFLFRKFTKVEGMASIEFLEVLRDHYQTGSKNTSLCKLTQKQHIFLGMIVTTKAGKMCHWNGCAHTCTSSYLLNMRQKKKKGRSSTPFEQSGYTVQEALQKGSCCI